MPESSLRLFDTARDRVVAFEPAGTTVSMYVCGITPYDATHVGHAATFIVFDILQRRLIDLGFEPRCVRNVTDVDDSLLARARDGGVHYLDLAAAALATFEADLDALGLLAAHSEPRATSAISDVRSLIGRALDAGAAYESGGNVYFDTGARPGFGSLSRLPRAVMIQLSVRRGGQPDDPLKRDPLDVPMWQVSRPDEPAWPSRWGSGRPGWHVECAALALRELGAPIDLHGGGSDLLYPHHECEAAMAEAALSDGPFTRHWMHVAMVRVDGAKMSKSADNLAFVSDLRARFDPMAIRLAIAAQHYRTPWEWDGELVERAAECVERWRAAGPGDGALSDVRASLDDDLATPDAVAAIDAAARAGHGVSEACALLGIT
ncbi:MAG TPA: cysteine--tRNA ligase [Acidimicrobiia bacterium]|nr:cysteine--tRNA ligase [Acidimicrobiia bacterium]